MRQSRQWGAGAWRAEAGPARRRDGGREGCLIRLFVKLAGQLVAPPGPRGSRLSQWAPREQFSPRLTRAIITDLIKMKSETGHVGASALPA